MGAPAGTRRFSNPTSTASKLVLVRRKCKMLFSGPAEQARPPLRPALNVQLPVPTLGAVPAAIHLCPREGATVQSEALAQAVKGVGEVGRLPYIAAAAGLPHTSCTHPAAQNTRVLGQSYRIHVLKEQCTALPFRAHESPLAGGRSSAAGSCTAAALHCHSQAATSGSCASLQHRGQQPVHRCVSTPAQAGGSEAAGSWRPHSLAHGDATPHAAACPAHACWEGWARSLSRSSSSHGGAAGPGRGWWRSRRCSARLRVWGGRGTGCRAALERVRSRACGTWQLYVHAWPAPVLGTTQHTPPPAGLAPTQPTRTLLRREQHDLQQQPVGALHGAGQAAHHVSQHLAWVHRH